MQIVLASASPYRKTQLENFGVRFDARRPRVDEDELKRAGPREPAALTRYLAEAKARSLALVHPDAVIIGSDQLVELDGARLDKPGTAAAARAQLERLSGRAHRLITSVAVIFKTRTEVETQITDITLRALGHDEIAAYVDLDRPLDCAGSYKIERAGLGLVANVRGDDPGAIQGLPLVAMTRALAKLGISLTDLWRSDAHS